MSMIMTALKGLVPMNDGKCNLPKNCPTRDSAQAHIFPRFIWRRGQIFGIIGLLSSDERQIVTVKVVPLVDVYVLDKGRPMAYPRI